MRDIKFRAWLKEKKEMRLVKAIKYFIDVPGNDDVSTEIQEVEVVRNYTLNPEEVILLQYTGLKDKNGKEIYEGDIVKHGDNAYGTFKNALSVVEWFEDNYQYIFKKKHFRTDEHDNLVYDSEVLANAGGGVGEMPEVIGNIYENPKLLQQ